MKNPILILFSFVLFAGHAQSQGCIMVRNISGFGQYSLTDNAFTTSNWQINIIGRYFKAYHDYKGTEDQKTPKADQNIIQSYSTDISVGRLFNQGWSMDFSFPISSNSRTADKEHGGVGTTRHTTNTFGIGDIRFTIYKWLLKPTVNQKGNIQIGIGLKLPTGDYKYQDYFYKTDSTKVLAPVNGSIQLGDGGTGVILQLNTFYFFNKTISLYGNFYYLINPRNQNGVSTTTGGTPSALSIKTGNDVYSVPDVYSLRGGVNLTFKKFSLSLGLRDEGVPLRDLVGGNYGLRRPGYNLSVEPGILYKMSRASIYAYVPFIVSRTIKQGLADVESSEITGKEVYGTGTSGDYSIFLGVLFKL